MNWKLLSDTYCSSGYHPLSDAYEKLRTEFQLKVHPPNLSCLRATFIDENEIVSWTVEIEFFFLVDADHSETIIVSPFDLMIDNEIFKGFKTDSNLQSFSTFNSLKPPMQTHRREEKTSTDCGFCRQQIFDSPKITVDESVWSEY